MNAQTKPAMINDANPPTPVPLTEQPIEQSTHQATAHSAEPTSSAYTHRANNINNNVRTEWMGKWSSPQRILLLCALLFALLLVHVFYARNKLQSVREELARRLASQDAIVAENKLLSHQASDTARDLQAKLSVAETKLADSQNQQLALEQLYQDLAKNREDWALAEIEQTLSMASQQLQLAGNVQGALIALNNADARLARSERAQYLGLRRALAKDIERLKALPNVDVAGLALRLDQLANQVEILPMLAQEKPLPTSKAESETKTTVPVDNGFFAQTKNAWIQNLRTVWNDFSQLLRIRRVDTPQALMLMPGQAYFVRENVKLRLYSARIALLARNETLFRSDLAAVNDALAHYFDLKATAGSNTLALLKQIAQSNVNIELPNLAGSLQAVRTIKAKP